MPWTIMMFKDLSVGVKFGYKDYFFIKVSETHASVDGQQIYIRPDALVMVETV